MATLKYAFIASVLLILLGSNNLLAQQLIYTPINPSFGGNPYNASWMLSEAQAQNDLTKGSGSSSSYNNNPLEDFKNSLNRQILSQLSRNLITSTFGTSSSEMMTLGHYELGDYLIDIAPSSDGISISIMDATNGSETSIIVPYFNY